MKDTGKINKRAQRKWFFFFPSEKKTLLGAGSTRESFMLPPLPPTHLRLLCSILAFLLPITLKRPRQNSVDASFDSLLWQRSFFPVSPALTWEVVKNVDGCRQCSLKKKPWCWKKDSSERLLYPDVLSFASSSPCDWIVLGFFFTLFFLKSVVPDGSIPQTLSFIYTDSRSCHSLHTKLSTKYPNPRRCMTHACQWSRWHCSANLAGRVTPEFTPRFAGEATKTLL